MICPRCGKTNPNFFVRCLECGARLPKRGEKPTDKKKLLVYGITGTCSFLVLIILVLNFPAISGWILSIPAFFHGAPVSQVPQIHQFGINDPARIGDLQMTVTGIRDGITFNDQKFSIVTANLENDGSKKTLHFTTNDFHLIDPLGQEYSSVGIGDGITDDLAPGSRQTVDLRYIVLKSQTGLRLRFDPRVPLGTDSETTTYYDFML